MKDRKAAPTAGDVTTAETIHLVEVGGKEGVFQHTAALSGELSKSGRYIVLHTTKDAELAPRDGVRFCGCINRHTGVHPRTLRKALSVGSFVGVLLGHFPSKVRQDELVHVQGASPLCSLLVLWLRLLGRTVIFSPHNTFSRSNSLIEKRMLQRAAQKASRLVVFSQVDHARAAEWGASATKMPLVQHVPKVSPKLVTTWRTRLLGAREPDFVVGLFGQIRADKRPELFLQTLALLPNSLGVIIGNDCDGLANHLRHSAFDLGVDLIIIDEYIDLRDFAAAMSCVDVIVAPYSRASQSGILSLAQALGKPTVASDVGGLSELATVCIAGTEARDYASAVRSVASTQLVPVSVDVQELMAVYEFQSD